MNTKLSLFCLKLWIVGFLGMWISRAFLGGGPGSCIWFDCCMRLSLIGGLTYVWLAVLSLWSKGGTTTG